jgi:hypothetical protein
VAITVKTVFFVKLAESSKEICFYKIKHFLSLYIAKEIQEIKEGMKMIESKTCIRFIERTDQENWIRIQSLDGCWSELGKFVKKGPQSLSLEKPGCIYRHIVAHEFIHALGFHHEQVRPDRDDFVEVLYQNIIESIPK